MSLIWVFLLVSFIAPQIHAQTLVAPTTYLDTDVTSGSTYRYTVLS